MRVAAVMMFAGSLAIMAAPLLLIRAEKVIKDERRVLNGTLTTYEYRRRNLLAEWLRRRLR